MTTRRLIVYPNCSKGGVTSVFRGRAAASPEEQFDVVFLQDRGGRDAFEDLKNVSVRIVRKDRAPAYLTHVASFREYDSISFLSTPDLTEKASWPDGPTVNYEFHSSDLNIITKEIGNLKLDRINHVVAPSQFMADQIAPLLPENHADKVTTVPNLVDQRIFHPPRDGEQPSLYDFDGKIPLVWLGRFDKGKSYRSFVRLLGALPEQYVGVLVTSMESDPQRAADFYGEVYAQQAQSRITVLQNIPQPEIADLYRGAQAANGFLISTSLLESFGYTVAEAIATGLRVVAFDLPALREHPDHEHLVQFVDVGSVTEMRDSILKSQR